MIPFFRKIRKKMADDNKSMKYMKYAIGEILLVVIGILIALQVNNWNEERKFRNVEFMYLNGLKHDLEFSGLEIKRVIDKTDRIEKAIDTLGIILKNYNYLINSTNIDTLLSNTDGFTIFMGNQGMMNDILNSGQLNIIENNYLRKEIASWEANLKMISEYETLYKISFEKFIEKLDVYLDLWNVVNNQNVFMEDKKDEFIEDIQFRNTLFEHGGNSFELNEL